MLSAYSKNELVAVWKDTTEAFRHRTPSVPDSSKFKCECGDLDEDDLVIENGEVEVTRDDTFNLAMRYVAEGLNPMVLNMASDFMPGGGVRKGSTAQEEELFRRSNAHLTHPKTMYPLASDEVIYSPEVTVIKGSRDTGYRRLDSDVKVAMLACAAIRQPQLQNGNQYNDVDCALMVNKVESIFKIGILMKHDSLVLGATGCGAFRNPPEEVAAIFQAAVAKYGKYFKKIGFAILEVKRLDRPNHTAFSRVFG